MHLIKNTQESSAPDEGTWSEDLQCYWLAWEPYKNSIVLHLPEESRADLRGAVKIATILMPQVKILHISYGKEIESFIRKPGSEIDWIADK